jgi:hypothetical protein
MPMEDSHGKGDACSFVTQLFRQGHTGVMDRNYEYLKNFDKYQTEGKLPCEGTFKDAGK